MQMDGRWIKSDYHNHDDDDHYDHEDDDYDKPANGDDHNYNSHANGWKMDKK